MMLFNCTNVAQWPLYNVHGYKVLVLVHSYSFPQSYLRISIHMAQVTLDKVVMDIGKNCRSHVCCTLIRNIFKLPIIQSLLRV